MATSDSGIYADSIKTQFESEDDIYFSAIVFTIWDNIYGPRVMKIWQNQVTGREPTSYEVLHAVATYTLTGEACRNGKLDGVETKLYCLSDKGIIATAFLFTVYHGKRSDLFSLLFVLPYSELSEWLCRHVLLCDKMKDILNSNLIPHISSLYSQVCFIFTCITFQDKLYAICVCMHACMYVCVCVNICVCCTIDLPIKQWKIILLLFF